MGRYKSIFYHFVEENDYGCNRLRIQHNYSNVKESTPLQMKTRVDSNPHVIANVMT